MSSREKCCLRAAVAADISAVLRLWLDAGATPSETDNAAALELLLRRVDSRLIVAVDGDVIIGALICCFDGWRGNMYRLAVHPGRRRQGIATRLVREGELWLKSIGCSRITALVETNHEWAVRFWISAGYGHDEKMQRHFKNLT